MALKLLLAAASALHYAANYSFSGTQMSRSLLRVLSASIALAVLPSLLSAQGFVFGFSGGPGTQTRLVINGALSIDASDRGWYDPSGYHDTFNDNYIAGADPEFGTFRNFFVFNLGQGIIVTSAALELYNPGGEDLGFSSINPSETYRLWDYLGSATALLDGTAGVAGFEDLGTGTFFGSKSVSASDNGQFVTVALNAAAIASLNNSAGGNWIVGGSIEEPIDVPEPASGALLVTGLGGLFAAWRRRQTA